VCALSDAVVGRRFGLGEVKRITDV